jgi:hypothetical protein
MSPVQLFSSVAGAVPCTVACCFARHSRDVFALFVRDVLIVACWLRVIRARRALNFVRHQRAVSRVYARHFHAVVLFRVS